MTIDDRGEIPSSRTAKFEPKDLKPNINMTKESLREKLDGNELDLSLSNLTKVPVKELVRVDLLKLIFLVNQVSLF